VANERDPFDLPEDRHHVLNVSGGLTSGYMLWRFLDFYDGTLPDNVSVIFANTGKERPQTLDFLRDMEEAWSVPITWVQYYYDGARRGTKNDQRHRVSVVDYATASRDGTPFRQMIQARRVPNITMRLCTWDLKVMSISRYLRWFRGIKNHVDVVGIRKDERRRAARLLRQECRIYVPLYYAGVTLRDVTAFWDAQEFPKNFRTGAIWSNCDLCFLKTRSEKLRILRDDPSVADWWIDMEETHGGTFRRDYSVRELTEIANGTGEQLGLWGDEPTYSCFCGD